MFECVKKFFCSKSDDGSQPHGKDNFGVGLANLVSRTPGAIYVDPNCNIKINAATRELILAAKNHSSKCLENLNKPYNRVEFVGNLAFVQNKWNQGGKGCGRSPGPGFNKKPKFNSGRKFKSWYKASPPNRGRDDDSKPDDDPKPNGHPSPFLVTIDQYLTPASKKIDPVHIIPNTPPSSPTDNVSVISKQDSIGVNHNTPKRSMCPAAVNSPGANMQGVSSAGNDNPQNMAPAGSSTQAPFSNSGTQSFGQQTFMPKAASSAQQSSPVFDNNGSQNVSPMYPPYIASAQSTTQTISQLSATQVAQLRNGDFDEHAAIQRDLSSSAHFPTYVQHGAGYYSNFPKPDDYYSASNPKPRGLIDTPLPNEGGPNYDTLHGNPLRRSDSHTVGYDGVEKFENHSHSSTNTNGHSTQTQTQNSSSRGVNNQDPQERRYLYQNFRRMSLSVPQNFRNESESPAREPKKQESTLAEKDDL